MILQVLRLTFERCQDGFLREHIDLARFSFMGDRNCYGSGFVLVMYHLVTVTAEC